LLDTRGNFLSRPRWASCTLGTKIERKPPPEKARQWQEAGRRGSRVKGEALKALSERKSPTARPRRRGPLIGFQQKTFWNRGHTWHPRALPRCWWSRLWRNHPHADGITTRSGDKSPQSRQKKLRVQGRRSFIRLQTARHAAWR